MKKLLIISMLLLSAVVLAQLPSWGMTEAQYKMPNRAAKLADIGKQAVKNNWQLKVTAPQAWHESIRTGLSDEGKKDVMVTFKDSLHNSVSVSASKAKNMGQNISSSDSSQVVQKQVMIEDKPDIDTSVERPEFNDEFMNGESVVADVGLELEMPKADTKATTKAKSKPAVKATAKPETKPVVKTEAKPVTKPAVKPEAKPVVKQVVEPVVEQVAAQVVEAVEAADNQSDNDSEVTQAAKSHLRKRYAKNKQTSGTLAYASINQSDELFIKDGVVLVERKYNGRSFYYWMKETFDAKTHAFNERSNERFEKTVDAESNAGAQTAGQNKKATSGQKTDRTSLVLTAVTDNLSDQDDLRRDYIRNKVVTKSYSSDILKSGDLIYTQNDTVLVVRRLSRINEIHFWLEGDVNVTEDITMMRPNEFKLK